MQVMSVILKVISSITMVLLLCTNEQHFVNMHDDNRTVISSLLNVSIMSNTTLYFTYRTLARDRMCQLLQTF